MRHSSVIVWLKALGQLQDHSRLNEIRIGVVTVSGLPLREDHEMAVAALADLAGAAMTTLALP